LKVSNIFLPTYAPKFSEQTICYWWTGGLLFLLILSFYGLFLWGLVFLTTTICCLHWDGDSGFSAILTLLETEIIWVFTSALLWVNIRCGFIWLIEVTEFILSGLVG
jgi:hypothetical protein